jgi:Flp pilus assembly protein TadB
MERLPEPRRGPLTDHERQVLARLAAHESDADPAFARRLSERPGRRSGRVPWLVAAVLAVIGVALLLVPGVWVLAAVATIVIVVVPVALIAWALSQGDRPPM